MITLTVITGPTASGKSALAVEVAHRLGCDIISADSRQIYRRMPVTTAVPSLSERGGVTHHMLEILEPDEYFSAARYEQEALELIAGIERRGQSHAVVCGGSMMYIHALLHGLDELPAISERVRRETLELYEREGIAEIRRRVQELDPDYYATADPDNHRRLIHALEIMAESGKAVSALRTGRKKERPFRARLFALEMPREELFDRINRRVERMVADGMEAEARSLYGLRGANALNTVGFKEMFAWFDGKMDRDTAIARIAKNTRVYAKKQMTWLRNAPEFRRVSPADALSEILSATCGARG